MNKILVIVLAFLCAGGGAFAEPTDKEFMALMNKVQMRLGSGDVKALDQLMTLPGSWSTPAFLTIFKQNYNIYGYTPTNRAIGVRCAQLAFVLQFHQGRSVFG